MDSRKPVLNRTDIIEADRDKVHGQEVVPIEHDQTSRPSIGCCLLKQDGQIIWLSDAARYWLQDGEGVCNRNLFKPHCHVLHQEYPLVVKHGGSFRFIAMPFKLLTKGEKKPFLIAVVITPTFATKLEEMADHFHLSMREIEVLKDMINGLSFKQIASHLRIALPTVQVYRTRLAQKLSLEHPADLTGWLWKTFVI